MSLKIQTSHFRKGLGKPVEADTGYLSLSKSFLYIYKYFKEKYLKYYFRQFSHYLFLSTFALCKMNCLSEISTY